MSKPFFYRIDAASLIDFATDIGNKKFTLLQFAKALQKGKSEIPYIQGIIDEAHDFIEKKKLAGSSGGKAKASSAKAKRSSAKAKRSSAIAKASTPLASSSSSSSTEEEKPFLAPKPRKPKVPSGDQQLFIAWWLMAYKAVTGTAYVMSSKEAKHVKEMLSSLSTRDLIAKSSYFLVHNDPFYADKRDLGMFRSVINKLPLISGEHVEAARELGIIPPEGVKFADWQFWETNNDTEA